MLEENNSGCSIKWEFIAKEQGQDLEMEISMKTNTESMDLGNSRDDSVKCLPDKSEDKSLVPSTQIQQQQKCKTSKKRTQKSSERVVHTYNLNDVETEKGKSLELMENWSRSS